jgi:enoyl-CoA hydratase/carnithine racemase
MAFTSEPIPARTMQQYGVVNRVFSDDALAAESLSFAQKIAGGPTLAHAAPKALLRAWALRGVGAADEALFDIVMPLFETEDVKKGIPSAVSELAAGEPRPALPWSGH